MHRWLVAALTAGALLWVALIIAAPLWLADGSTPLPWIVYEAAALVCHQRPERSFHLSGAPLPVCARCFGLYASGAIAAVAATLTNVAPGAIILTSAARSALVAAAMPTAVTVAIEWLGVAQPSNLHRAIAAVPLGATAAWLFVRALRAEAPPRHAGQMRYHA